MKKLSSLTKTALIFLALLVLASCYVTEDHLYDKVGSVPGPTGLNSSPDPRVNKVPNYYYRYGPTVPASAGYNNAPQPQYRYNYAPQQYAPYPSHNSGYQAPGSRFYSNPYDIPPSPYYQRPYDSDQYYVPPSNYYNQEYYQNSTGAADEAGGAVHF